MRIDVARLPCHDTWVYTYEEEDEVVRDGVTEVAYWTGGRAEISGGCEGDSAGVGTGPWCLATGVPTGWGGRFRSTFPEPQRGRKETYASTGDRAGDSRYFSRHCYIHLHNIVVGEFSLQRAPRFFTLRLLHDEAPIRRRVIDEAIEIPLK